MADRPLVPNSYPKPNVYVDMFMPLIAPVNPFEWIVHDYASLRQQQRNGDPFREIVISHKD